MVRHRAEFGISIAQEYWGLGIGRALMDACIECARKAGYVQLELNVVANNLLIAGNWMNQRIIRKIILIYIRDQDRMLLYLTLPENTIRLMNCQNYLQRYDYYFLIYYGNSQKNNCSNK